VDMIHRTLDMAEQRGVDELRSVENARLDRAQAAIWTAVLQGDLKAIDTFLKISARRARLNGLDAPTQINLKVSVRAEMEAALNELEQVVLRGELVAKSDADVDRDD